MSRQSEPVYSLGAVVRLTGLSAHAIRAWERRYGAVRPRRSPGGTRRFSEEDVARLLRLRAATEAGHRIGDLAALDDEALERLVARAATAAPAAPAAPGLEPLLAALDRLDASGLERELAVQFAALGPGAFARLVAAPLLREVGDRWEDGRSSIASEHLATALVRSLLGAALRAPARRDGAPRLLFATPGDERHELGLLVAAIAALGAGADVTYLGPDLPAEEVAEAARRIGAAAVALSAVALAAGPVRHYLDELRRRLPGSVSVWVGGPARVAPVAGVERIDDLGELERRVALLARPPLSKKN
jgi:DNA-binding transcriptional MerR regulator/methylmalonyl-CoA mutase cobalamin-binding subunit